MYYGTSIFARHLLLDHLSSELGSLFFVGKSQTEPFQHGTLYGSTELNLYITVAWALSFGMAQNLSLSFRSSWEGVQKEHVCAL